MAGLNPATHRARVCERKRLFGAPTRAGWMGGSRPPMTVENYDRPGVIVIVIVPPLGRLSVQVSPTL